MITITFRDIKNYHPNLLIIKITKNSGIRIPEKQSIEYCRGLSTTESGILNLESEMAKSIGHSI